MAQQWIAAGFLHHCTVSTQLLVTQNADIRYLGRLLGDVIRAYGGQALFDRIETIRSASVDRYRGVSALRLCRDTICRSWIWTTRFRSCAASCCSRCWPTSPRTGRAQCRRRDGRCGRRTAAASPTKAFALEEVAHLLEQSLIVPVLTAHPTEVMRKSMLDHRNRIAELMALRDEGCSRRPMAM